MTDEREVVRRDAMNSCAMNSLALLAGLLSLCLGACTSTGGGVKDVKLNEVLALSDTQGDWLELHNVSHERVSLAGLGLRDSSNYWAFGDETIEAKGFVRVFCDGSGLAGRASFKLSSAGEPLTLLDGDGNVLDEVTYPQMRNNLSWGRFPDGEGDWTFLEEPTPGAANVKELSDAGPDAHAQDAGATSAPCTKNEQCISARCHNYVCVSAYPLENGSGCVGNGHCRSLLCIAGICAAGNSPTGSACLYGEECASTSCVANACADATDGGVADQQADQIVSDQHVVD